jgi:hypothetical protein
MSSSGGPMKRFMSSVSSGSCPRTLVLPGSLLKCRAANQSTCRRGLEERSELGSWQEHNDQRPASTRSVGLEFAQVTGLNPHARWPLRPATQLLGFSDVRYAHDGLLAGSSPAGPNPDRRRRAFPRSAAMPMGPKAVTASNYLYS